MNCLCCGKPLRPSSLPSGWHPACIRRFFQTKTIPELELDERTLMLLAEKNISNGYTVPGVQKKLSLHLSREVNARLTLVDYPTGYILKPQVKEFEALPESEHMVMCMAEQSGLNVVPHALLRINGEYAYITRRIDREIQISGSFRQFAMEDFCQLSLRLTQDKYKGSYEQCAKVIRKFSVRPGIDLSELFLRLIFCFLTGNSDMHLKNFSLIENAPESAEYILSPAYDLLPVNILIPEDTEETALQINGKKRNLQKKHFLAFAQTVGISRNAAESMICAMLKNLPTWQSTCEKSYLPEQLKKRFSELMISRAGRLE